MTAQLKGNQMVLLVVGRRRIGVAVRLDLLCLECVRVLRRRPDSGRVAGDADRGENVVLGDPGISYPRSAGRVGQTMHRVAFAGGRRGRGAGTDDWAGNLRLMRAPRKRSGKTDRQQDDYQQNEQTDPLVAQVTLICVCAELLPQVTVIGQVPRVVFKPTFHVQLTLPAPSRPQSLPVLDR